MAYIFAPTEPIVTLISEAFVAERLWWFLNEESKHWHQRFEADIKICDTMVERQGTRDAVNRG